MNANLEHQSSPQDPADDVVILDPDFSLKQKIGAGVSVTELLRPEVLQQAQQVIQQAKQDFVKLLKEDVALLHTQLQQIENVGWDADSLKQFTGTALQIKARAGTFGYPLASEVARKLFLFCEEGYRAKTDHKLVLRKHVEGLLVIMNQGIEGDGGAIGKELILSLDKLADKFR